MIINCEACGKTYQINPEMLEADQTTTTCEACYHQIVVERSAVSPSSEEDPFEVLEDLSQLNPPDRADSSDDPFDILDEVSHSQPSEQAGSPGDTPPVSYGSDKAGASSVSPQTPQKETIQLPKKPSALQSKLTLWMVLVALLPLVIFTAYAYRFTSARLHAHIAGLSARATAGLAFQVDGWMEQNFRMLKTVSRTPDIIAMKWRKKAPLLKTIQKEYPWIRQIVTMDREKRNVGEAGNPPQIDFSSCACVDAVINGKSAAWDTMIDKKTGKPLLVMAVPVNARPGQIDGILAGLVDLDDLVSRIARWEKGSNGNALLVDMKGNRVIYTGAADAVQNTDPNSLPLVAAFHRGQKGPILFSDSNGKPSVGQVLQTASGWEVAIQIPEKEALDGLNQAQSAYLSLLGATLIMGMLMALLFAWLFTKPIRDLTSSADRISMGEQMPLDASANRKDEIGDLAKAITRMQESIRISMERLRRHRKSS
jgi:methyl-accepting chemotaxis protein